MSPEQILAVFQDWKHFSDATPPPSAGEFLTLGSPITFFSTVGQWRQSYDLRPVKTLGRYLNRLFNLRISDSRWESALKDAASLQKLCVFIYEAGAKKLALDDRFIGEESYSKARVFRLICQQLSSADVPVDELQPESPLKPLLSQHMDAVLLVVRQLCPQALPAAATRLIDANPLAIVIAMTLLLVVFNALFNYSASLLGAIILTAVLAVVALKVMQISGRSSFYFHGIETVGDLVRLIVQCNKRIDA